MAGIQDLLRTISFGDSSKIYDEVGVEQKQGKLTPPLNAYVREPDVFNQRLTEIFDELGKDDDKPVGHTDRQLEFLSELSKVVSKQYTPQYIQDEKYVKNPYSFFATGYDANADIKYDPTKVEKEFQDFLKVTQEPRLNYILDSDTLSPFAEDLLPFLAEYRSKYRTLPKSFDDFIKNRQTFKG